MQFFSQIKRRMFMLAALSLVTVAASASSTAPQPGVEYQVLKRPQPVDGGKKIEVVEFFGYFCPHCYALEPLIAEWVKKQGDNISFKRIHVNFHNLVPQQKLYFTMEAMGKADEYHMKAFTAFHVERNRLQTDADIMEFVSKSGLDKQKFSDIYNSFSISTSKLSRAAQLTSAYQIDGVPSIAVDGRFVTSPVLAVTTSTTRVTEEMQNRAVIQVLDALVAKVQKEKNGAPAAAASASSTSASASASTKAASKKK